MSAAIYWGLATLRRGWRASVAAALLIALACAVPTAAAMAARRSATVVDRVVEELQLADVELQLEDFEDSVVQTIREMPDVELVGPHSVIFLTPSGTGLKPYLEFFAVAPTDEVWAYEMMRPRIQEGRMPALDAPNEAFVSRVLAERLGIGVGDTFSVDTLTLDAVFEVFETGGIPEPDGPTVDVTISGIGIIGPEFIAAEQIPNGTILFSPAFLQTYPVVAAFNNIVDVTLLSGSAGLEQFVENLHAEFGPQVLVTPVEQEIEQIRSTVDVQYTALLLFLVISGLAALVAVVQIATRTASRHSSVMGTLEALGMSTRRRVAAVTLRFVPAVVVGAVVGAVGAVALTSMLPFGIARRLEADRSWYLDWPILLAGLAITVVGSLAAVAVTAVIAERRRHGALGRVRRAHFASIAGALRAPFAIGSRWALVPGRGRSSTPVRSSLAGTVIAVAGTVGAIIFGASLGRLLDNPPRYGVDYELEVGVVGDEASDEEALVEIRALAERDEVAEVSFVRVVQMNLVGESHDGFGMESISGDIGYGIVEGREPAAVDEVVIGAALLDELDLEVGDDFVLPGTTGTLRVVGQAVFPPLDDGDSVASGLGFTRHGLDAALADLGPDGASGGFPQALVTVADGVDVELQREKYVQEFGYARDGRRPSSVSNLNEARAVPVLLALFLVGLGVLALAHSTAVAASRRRSDLAVLRCLGFQRRDLSATATAHTFTTLAAGSIIGLPLGVLLGVWAWRTVASDVGVATDAASIGLAIGAVIVGAIVLGVALVIPWARSARNTRPARILRAE